MNNKDKQRVELKGCFVDYDGDRTILVTPEKGKQFEIEFENISLASVALKKVAGEWNLKSGERLSVRYPLAYLRKCLKNIQDEERKAMYADELASAMVDNPDDENNI